MSVDLFADGDPVILSDRRGREHLAFLEAGARLHVVAGYVDADDLIGADVGCRIRTSKGEVLAVYRPTLEEYVLNMPRVAQIIAPKDSAFIVQWADIFPGATVIEAGIGSGGLTLALLRAIGPDGRLIGFERRKEFANRARKNIEGWPEDLAGRLELRIEDVHERLGDAGPVDRVVLDLPDPWETLPGVARALRPGGILLAYLPTIRQVDQLVVAVMDTRELGNPEVAEILVRPWVADRIRLRPAQRMVGHTGFLVRARRRGVMLPGADDSEPANEDKDS